MIDDRYYLHLFNSLNGFGPMRLARLGNYFPDFTTAFESDGRDLFEAGLEPNLIENWLEYKQSLNIDQEIASLQQHNIKLLIIDDDEYPRLLREIHSPPALLYYRGKVLDGEELCVGVVGTRKITNYGRSITPALIAPLAEAGITVVSGMAYGVDALAHESALKYGGRTIAVLGGGLDDAVLYPRHHVKLAHDIIDGGGLLLSEHPPGRLALPQNFVVRNRIIAGMSAGVLIVECDLKSGALITAKCAGDENRSVYAVPGPIYSPTSAGPNNLLKEGAKPVTEGLDIISDLNIEVTLQAAPKNFVMLTPQEQEVLEMVTREPILADDIIAQIPLDPSVTTAALTFLEIKGHIQNLGAQHYIRIK